MTPSENLFQLVRSLDIKEKKYVKKEISKHYKGKHNITAKLFQAVDEQKTYNETAIIQKPGTCFKIKSFPKEKHYLYHLILKCLRNYHAGSNPSISMQLNNILINVEILFEKILYEQCTKLLKKAEKLASESGKDLFHLEICEWEKKLKTGTRNFIRHYCNLLSFNNFRGDFDKSIEQIPEIEAGLKQFKHRFR